MGVLDDARVDPVLEPEFRRRQDEVEAAGGLERPRHAVRGVFEAAVLNRDERVRAVGLEPPFDLCRLIGGVGN